MWPWIKIWFLWFPRSASCFPHETNSENLMSQTVLSGPWQVVVYQERLEIAEYQKPTQNPQVVYCHMHCYCPNQIVFFFWFDFMNFILMSHNICPHVCLVLESRAHVFLLCILPTIFFQTVDPRMQCWRSFGCGLSGVENATASRSLNAFSWGTWTNASFGKRKSRVGLVLYTYIDWDAPPRSNTRQ